MPSAFSYSKRDLDLSPGRVYTTGKKNSSKIYTVSTMTQIRPGYLYMSMAESNGFPLGFPPFNETLGKWRRPSSAATKSMSFNQIPKLNSEFFPWKVTLPQRKVRIVFQAPFFRGKLLTFGWVYNFEMCSELIHDSHRFTYTSVERINRTIFICIPPGK